MKKTLFTCFIIFSFIHETKAQTTFEKTYGTGAFEEAKSVRQTPDGGYIIGGTNLVKVDDLGLVEWIKPYPSLFANPTTDGGYILVDSNSPIVTFTKVDAIGDLLWQTFFSGGVWANEGNYIEEVNDGGYIVAGRFQSVTGSGMMLLKLNSMGQEQWRRTFSEITSAGFNDGFSVQQTMDNGFIIAGRTNIDYYEPTSHEDVYVVKTDSIGNLEWQRFFGGINDDSGFSVRQDNVGNYYIAGITHSFGIGVGSNMYLIKLNPSGDSLWTQTYGGNFEESATGLWTTNDGGCILTGSSNSFSNGDFDGYIVKTDANGDVLWTKNYGGTGIEVANSVQQTSDNGYAIVGYTNSMGAGDFDMFLLKTDSLGNIQTNLGSEEQFNSVNQLEVYPNPSNGIFSIESELMISSLKIITVSGEIIYSASVNANKALVDLSQLSSGIYFYQATIGDTKMQQSGRVILE